MVILNKEKILEQAKLFVDEGKFDKAIREYEKILDADPADLRVKLRIAELYTKRKQIHDAIRIYREVADAYAGEGFYLKAVTVHKNILRLNPAMTEINEQLAVLYENMGLPADAIRQYEIVAAAMELKNQKDRVIEVLRKIVKLNPKDGRTRIRLAECLQRADKLDESIEQYEEYARQLEADPSNRARLTEVFEKILAHKPDRQDLVRKIIHIHHELNDVKKTLKWLEYGKDFTEKDPDLLRMMALLYAGLNQNETARSKYMILADVCQAAGNIEGALSAYCDIFVLFPDEEERLERKIEEMKPGAMAELSERARLIREDLEHQELERQDAEENAKHGRAPSDSSAKASLPPDGKTPASEGPPAKELIPLEDVKAIFDLANVYRQMGMMDEAVIEYEKARAIYMAHLEAGTAGPDIPVRLAQIEVALSGRKVRAKLEAQSKLKNSSST